MTNGIAAQCTAQANGASIPKLEPTMAKVDFLWAGVDEFDGAESITGKLLITARFPCTDSDLIQLLFDNNFTKTRHVTEVELTARDAKAAGQ